MATQTINFPFIAGQTGLSIRLRSLVDRSIVDTEASAETVADNGVQTAEFTDVPAAKYLVQLVSGTTVWADDTVTLTLTTATFWVDSVNGASGGGGDATLAKQNEILDAIGDLGASALSAAVWTAGVITGFPTSLVIGDSYVDDVNRHIKIYYRDSNDDPITTIGSKSVLDEDFVPVLRISQDNRSSVVVATCSWVAAVGPTEGYVKVELPKDQTRRASEGVAEMQLVFQWGSTIEVQVAKQTVNWIRKI